MAVEIEIETGGHRYDALTPDVVKNVSRKLSLLLASIGHEEGKCKLMLGPAFHNKGKTKNWLIPKRPAPPSSVACEFNLGDYNSTLGFCVFLTLPAGVEADTLFVKLCEVLEPVKRHEWETLSKSSPEVNDREVMDAADYRPVQLTLRDTDPKHDFSDRCLNQILGVITLTICRGSIEKGFTQVQFGQKMQGVLGVSYPRQALDKLFAKLTRFRHIVPIGCDRRYKIASRHADRVKQVIPSLQAEADKVVKCVNVVNQSCGMQFIRLVELRGKLLVELGKNELEMRRRVNAVRCGHDAIQKIESQITDLQERLACEKAKLTVSQQGLDEIQTDNRPTELAHYSGVLLAAIDTIKQHDLVNGNVPAIEDYQELALKAAQLLDQT